MVFHFLPRFCCQLTRTLPDSPALALFVTRPETDALRPLPTLTRPSSIRVLSVAGSVLTRVTCTDFVTGVALRVEGDDGDRMRTEGEGLGALPVELDRLAEPTSVPVKLRISLPSAWKVMRATLVASVATALMVSTSTYCSLVAGVLIVSDGGSKSPHGPLSWSPCVATERKASHEGLCVLSVR
jgi:hypothetical protein